MNRTASRSTPFGSRVMVLQQEEFLHMKKVPSIVVALVLATLSLGMPLPAHAVIQGSTGGDCLTHYNMDVADCDRGTFIEKGWCVWRASEDYWACTVKNGF